MKIRVQLALLVAAVVIPVALLAGSATRQLREQQRAMYEQGYLERMRALRLALDTETEAAVRLLRGFGAERDLNVDPDESRSRFARRLQTQPGWAAIGWVDATGRLVAEARRDGEPAVPPPPASAAGDLVSNLVKLDDGRFVVYVTVPLAADGGTSAGALFAAIPEGFWLAFLRRYPVADDATLTLNDRDGVIVARTLNADRWIGQRSTADFLQRIAGRDEGAFVSAGLEGQRFYSAFSRLATSGWSIGTGVPSENVEAALRDSLRQIVAGVVATSLVVALFAFWMGSRIIGALESLERAATRVGERDGEGAPFADEPELGIDEAETVRQTLQRAHVLLLARQSAAGAALRLEAAARSEAERHSAAKDEFIAMLGHELRNPLNAMSAASALLALPGGDGSAHERARGVMKRQVGRLTDLVNDMLDVARLESGKVSLERRPVDLGALARQVAESFADGGRSAHLQVETALAPAWVDGDETRLEQVVANLVDNACKYTPAGGRVRIASGGDGAVSWLAVEDDGHGIADELLPHVFDVFAQGQRTLERAEGGLGLGLTVVRRLVGLHDGTVSVASDGVGRGSRFRIELPATPAPLPAPADAEAGRPAASAGLHVSIVDDEADNRELLRLLLEDEGHRVDEAADGEAGAALIVAVEPDVAVVDIGMPKADGFELARRVRGSGRAGRTLLVALTGYGTPADRARAHEAGFDAFLVKPFDPDAFDRVLAEARAGGRLARVASTA